MVPLGKCSSRLCGCRDGQTRCGPQSTNSPPRCVEGDRGLCYGERPQGGIGPPRYHYYCSGALLCQRRNLGEVSKSGFIAPFAPTLFTQALFSTSSGRCPAERHGAIWPQCETVFGTESPPLNTSTTSPALMNLPNQREHSLRRKSPDLTCSLKPTGGYCLRLP